MEGKEGKEFKPNSLYQIMRRLGFFPTMRSSRAGLPASLLPSLLPSVLPSALYRAAQDFRVSSIGG